MKKKARVKTIPEMPLYMSSQQRGDALTELVKIIGDVPASAFEVPAEAYSQEAHRAVTPHAIKIGVLVSLAALGIGLPGNEWRQEYLLAVEAFIKQQMEQADGTQK